MPLEAIEIETAADPQATIIVLHGLGADGNDFVPVAQELAVAAALPVRFVFPHAPIRPVTVNGGHRMRAWYDVLGLDLVRSEDEAGLRESQVAIEALIARERGRGIQAARIVLAGFSQGAAMALQVGLRHTERLGGLAVLSGYLPLSSQVAAERASANAAVPIFFAHGRHDPVVAFSRATASRDALIALGYPIDWHEYDMAHSVCGPEIADLNTWLTAILV
jgi:phospholipase/carboxylesterase